MLVWACLLMGQETHAKIRKTLLKSQFSASIWSNEPEVIAFLSIGNAYQRTFRYHKIEVLNADVEYHTENKFPRYIDIVNVSYVVMVRLIQ